MTAIIPENELIYKKIRLLPKQAVLKSKLLVLNIKHNIIDAIKKTHAWHIDGLDVKMFLCFICSATAIYGRTKKDVSKFC